MESNQFRMPRVEDMPEFQNTKAMEQRLSKLSPHAAARIVSNIINQVYWTGPVTAEWVESEFADQEELEGRNTYTADDHPVEDMFGSEIQTGDKWFEDPAGRVVLNENVAQYLQEVAEVPCYRTVKS